MRSKLLILVFLAVMPVSAQSFSDLRANLTSAPAADRDGMISAFLASTTVPHFEDDSTAVFLWTGADSSMAVSGDMTGWSQEGLPMQRIEGTDLWFLERILEPDARIDYKLIRNGTDWILDPRNPNTAPSGFGVNSELAMPAYVQPWEIAEDPSVARGSLSKHTFRSAILSNERTVQVFVPADYDPQRPDPYPVILYHDGSDYTRIANVPVILDNLIAHGRIASLVAVFVDPVDREAEYATTSTAEFTRVIVEELMPWVEATYHVSADPARRAVTGPSYGGLVTARQCFEHPEEFGLCAPFSPSLWVLEGALLQAMTAGTVTGIKWYLDWGTYERTIAEGSRMFEAVLQQQNATFLSNEWHEGHSWGSWRAHQNLMLAYFFPGPNTLLSDPIRN